jgi:4'-phosphopantetheinyl transferase
VTDLVRVWMIPVDVPPGTAARCRDVLDSSECARAAEFSSSRDRQRYTVAHGALRILAAGELGTRPSELTWVPGRYGKPELAPPWSGLFTSLSHSGGMVAAAIAAGRPVGIDIQDLAPGLDTVALAARFYPPAEAAYVAAGRDASARAERFTHLWARKEAVVKAAGGRLWSNLKIAVLNREVVSCAEPPCPHRIADITSPAGFHAAVALPDTAPFVTVTTVWPSGPVSDQMRSG